jgi:putative endonuclease
MNKDTKTRMMNRIQKTYYVYITASRTRVLYIGVTGNLYKRIKQHKSKIDPDSFTAKYHVDRLVYFEAYQQVHEAIKREKQLKKWRREKKVNLIELKNPKWIDLSTQPFFDKGLRM